MQSRCIIRKRTRNIKKMLQQGCAWRQAGRSVGGQPGTSRAGGSWAMRTDQCKLNMV